MNIRLATTTTPTSPHIEAIESVRGNVTVDHRCSSLAELISVGRSGLVDVVLAVTETEKIQLATLEILQDQLQRGLVFLALTDDSEERQRLAQLGISTQPTQASGQQLVEWITQAVQVGDQPVLLGSNQVLTDQDQQFLSGVEQTTEKQSSNLEQASTPVDHDDGHAAIPEAKVTAVWGPAGAPGRSTVALNLATESQLAGHRTLLIDADTYGASIAPMLGFLEESAGLAQAVRAAETGRLDAKQLQRHARSASTQTTSLDVLTGLTRADRWPEIRPAALSTVIATAQEIYDHIVVDCGFNLEEDEELSFDIPAPQRNAATVTALANADTVLAVGTGDPIGLPRLIRALDELSAKTMTAKIFVIINKLWATSSGPAPKSQVDAVWQRFGPAHRIEAFLPRDDTTCAKALMGGQTLAEASPESNLRKTIAGLLNLCQLGQQIHPTQTGDQAHPASRRVRAKERKTSRLKLFRQKTSP